MARRASAAWANAVSDAQRDSLGLHAGEGLSQRGGPGRCLGAFGLEARDPVPQNVGQPARRRDLPEAEEAEGIVPGLAGDSRPRVLRSGRRALAAEPVPRVEPHEAAVAVHPGRGVVDEDRGPVGRLAGADREAVAPRIVDERHRECALEPRPKVAGVSLAQDVAPELADPLQPAAQAAEGRDGHGGQVLAGLRIRSMGAGPGEDDRMVVHLDQEGVVPAPAQVVSRVVVGGVAEPDRPGGLRSAVLQHDERLLEVCLVVVGALERRAPVVHPVEVHVVEDDPAALPHDPAVVHVTRVECLRLRVLDLRRSSGAAGHAPAEKQGRVESGVGEPREETDTGKPARAAERGLVRPQVPAGQLDAVQRVLGEPQEERLSRRRQRGRKRVDRDFAHRQEKPAIPLGRPHPQVARCEVRLDRRREEELALRVANDRLEGAQQGEIGLLERCVACHDTVSSRGCPYLIPNAARTGRWLR